MPRPTVCLNMIVKDESKNIIDCLKCVVDYIDYYLIVDTGSTDNTIELIETFMEEHGKEGKVISHIFETCECHPNDKTWYFDFEKNRNYAIEQAQLQDETKNATYLMFMDADDRVYGKIPVGEILSHKLDVCQLDLHYGGMVFPRNIFMKNDPSLNIRYEGALHETLDISKVSKIKLFQGDYHIIGNSDGYCSRITDRHEKYALIFESILEDPNCKNRSRQIFYCAQSWKDAGNIDKAIEYYKIRAEMKEGYTEERYISYYRLAQLYLQKKMDWNIIEKMCMMAYNICLYRSETLYIIQDHYKNNGNLTKAVEIGELAVKIPMPSGSLFVDKDIYNIHIPFTLAVSYYLLGKFRESYYYCEKINTEYAKNLGKECLFYLEDKISAAVYIDSRRINLDVEKNLVLLCNTYRITIVSDYFGLRYPTISPKDISEIEFDVIIYYDSIPSIPFKLRDEVKSIYLRLRPEMYMSFPYGVEAIVMNSEEIGMNIITDPCTVVDLESEQNEIAKPILAERELPVCIQRLSPALKDKYTMMKHKW